MALMPAAWVMASVTLTAPRARSCSLLMTSMLAGVSNGRRPSRVPVLACSSRVARGVSPETAMAGRVATPRAAAGATAVAAAGGTAPIAHAAPA
ncbi:hypothetical protein AXXA_24630 [Achromobacter insuavis AXX-A]|uniref:Uncharacterized protein n=1 Tax=Achromobacter insuavis AXX-A TaxID=1003200 RepID=F7T7I4_9BURK|nr:hypothetical protein AXXA_24630 [Achromobacter insuavis AXX-A]